MAPTKPKARVKPPGKARGGDSRGRGRARQPNPRTNDTKNKSAEAAVSTAVAEPRRLRSSRSGLQAIPAETNQRCSADGAASSSTGGEAKEEAKSAAAALVRLSVAARKCGAIRSASTPPSKRAASSSGTSPAARAPAGPPSSGKRERHGRCAEAGGYAALAQGSPARASGTLPGFNMSPSEIDSPRQSDDVIITSASARDATSTTTTRTPTEDVGSGASSNSAFSTVEPSLSTRRKEKGKAPARKKDAASSRTAAGKGRPPSAKAKGVSKRTIKKEPPEGIRAFVLEEMMVILERALAIGTDIHTKAFAFNNDHGRSNWYERMGKPVAATLRGNEQYMKVHGNGLDSLFGRDGMQHLKDWFVSTRKQEYLYRMKDGTGASGGKTEGDFNRLRRDVFACNPAVTKARTDESRMGLESLLDAEGAGENTYSDDERYAQEEDDMAERASGLGTPEMAKPDAKEKGRMKGFNPSEFQEGFTMASEQAASFEIQKLDILKQLVAPGKTSGSTTANSTEKRKVALQERQQDHLVRESRLSRGKEMYDLGLISKEALSKMYAEFISSEAE